MELIRKIGPLGLMLTVWVLFVGIPVAVMLLRIPLGSVREEVGGGE